MAFNGSGVFTRVRNWAQDKLNSLNPTAARFDEHDDDIALGLTNCITKDGQTTLTQNIPFGTRKITGLGDATAATDAMNRQASDARYLQGAVAPVFTAFPVELEGAAPILLFDETDAAANERIWFWRSLGGRMLLSSATDAAPTTAVQNAIDIDRSGTVVNYIALEATTITLNSVNITDYARLSLVPTFTGGQLRVAGAQAIYVWDETDAAANERLWKVYTNGGIWRLVTQTDAEGGEVTAISLDRTGTTVDSIALTATSVTVNGNAVLTAASSIAADQISTTYTDADTSTALTVGAGHAETIRRMTGASAVTITLPNSVPSGWAVGDTMVFIRGTAQTVTFTSAGTIRSKGTSTITVQNGMVSVTLAASGVWQLGGDV